MTIQETTIHGHVSEPLGTFPPSGIDVLIVGTGLAGLSAALECTRKGHNVRILERQSSINTLGQSACVDSRETRKSLC